MKNLLKQFCSTFGGIKRIQHNPNWKTLKMLYCSLVQSKIIYCIITWCHRHKTILQKTQKVCNKIFKIINKKRRKRALDDKCEFLSIDQLFRKEIAVFMFKHKTKRLPSILRIYFSYLKLTKLQSKILCCIITWCHGHKTILQKNAKSV